MDVVITGYGLISSAGGTASSSWQTIREGRAMLSSSALVPARGLTTTIAGEVAETDLPGNTSLERCSALAESAFAEAVDHAGIDGSSPRHRRGITVGTSLGGSRIGEAFHQQWLESGIDSANPWPLRDYPLHAVTGHLARRFEFHGPRMVHSNACAAGAMAIIHGAELIESGHADVVVAGGVDPLVYMSFAGFSSLGALDVQGCAPYTRSGGLTIGEGAGFVVLESRASASRRGARIRAELRGYGVSSDAYHVTAPDPRGWGVVRAIRGALSMADVSEADLDYINGHGTGTSANDVSELKVLGQLTKRQIPISSTKSMIGHTLGAAGGVEAVVTVMAIEQQTLPPTHVPPNAVAPDAHDIVPEVARNALVRNAVSNSLAFGGNNASLLFASPRFERGIELEEVPLQEAVQITRYAAMVGAASTASEVKDALFAGIPLYRSGETVLGAEGVHYPIGELEATSIRRGINPSMLRKMDPFSRSVVAVVAQLYADRKLSKSEGERTGIIISTASGPLSTVERFQRELLREGTGNSRLFPNTVMNAAAGHVSMQFGLRGPTATLCSGSTGTIGALHLASQFLRRGLADRIVLVAADEACEALLAGYHRVPGFLSTHTIEPFRGSGLAFSSAAVAVELSTASFAGASALATIRGFGFAADGSRNGVSSADGAALEASARGALGQAGISSDHVDLFVSGVSGLATDSAERDGLKRLGISERAVSTPKAVTGECQAASLLIGVLAGIWAKEEGIAPAPIERSVSSANHVRNVLVHAQDTGGNHQSVLIDIE